jgi:hypothetical protein
LTTEDGTRQRIAKLLEYKREQLGEDKFQQLVSEISDVTISYQQKHDALPEVPIGTLDGNAAEQRRLTREEAIKWVLIKQKYGI